MNLCPSGTQPTTWFWPDLSESIPKTRFCYWRTVYTICIHVHALYIHCTCLYAFLAHESNIVLAKSVQFYSKNKLFFYWHVHVHVREALRGMDVWMCNLWPINVFTCPMHYNCHPASILHMIRLEPWGVSSRFPRNLLELWTFGLQAQVYP